MKKSFVASDSMSNINNIECIAIGGSAGCLPVIMQIVRSLPSSFNYPIIIVIHRQRNVISEMVNILGNANQYKHIIEPDDKSPVKNCCIFLAPQNYHLLVEEDRTFSLDYSEAVQYSRPSIDVTFESAAIVYRHKLVAILLSGANNDGTAGLQAVVEQGGIAIAQNPDSADYPAMPMSAIHNVTGIKIMRPGEISEYLKTLVTEE